MKEDVIARDVIVSIGFDVDKSSIKVCVGTRDKVLKETVIGYDLGEVDCFLERLPGCDVRVLYEAGPFGYGLARHLDGRKKVRCIVVAPSLMPQAPGRRVKTNRRDARELMFMGWRPGEEVRFARVPTEEEEGERQLLRLREGYVRKRNRVMEQMKSLAYEYHRHDLLGDWGVGHKERLREAKLGHRYVRLSLDMYLEEYEYLSEQIKKLDKEVEELAGSERHREEVRRMTAVGGVGLLTAMSFRVEVFRPEEFDRAESVSCHLGLTPWEDSTGEQRRLGHIHRMGNAHLRWVLVQAAWCMVRWDEGAGRHFRRLSRRLGKKRAIVAIARRLGIGLWACQVRGTDMSYGWK